MPSALDRIRSYGALLYLALVMMLACPATADVLTSDASPTTTLHVAVGKSAPLPVTADVQMIVLSQPEIARVDQIETQSLYVIGREIGSTNLLVYGRDAKLLKVVNIEVGYDGPQLQEELADPARRTDHSGKSERRAAAARDCFHGSSGGYGQRPCRASRCR